MNCFFHVSVIWEGSMHCLVIIVTVNSGSTITCFVIMVSVTSGDSNVHVLSLIVRHHFVIKVLFLVTSIGPIGGATMHFHCK